ncbi:MAG: tetratricopeptide repeat protein, partial [Gaiellales bacterium]|nr:tetratricopeptide repeat protein [Gaiellales bacterium]
ALTGARRIAWGAILAMVVLVPLVMTDFTLPGLQTRLAFGSTGIVKLSVEIVLALVALGAWAWDLLRNGGCIRHTPLDWLILAWLGWVAITTVTSIHWPMSLFGLPGRYEGFLTFVVYALIYFLVLQFADTPARVRRLAQALFLTSLIVSVYGLLQYAGVVFVPEGMMGGRAFSTYGHPMYLGGFLVFTVTVSLGLALQEPRPIWRLFYWTGFALNELALIVTATRSAWASAVFSLVVLGIMVWRQRITVRPLDGFSFATCVALSAGLLWHVYRRDLIGGRGASLVDFSTGTGRERTLYWQAAVDAIKERPILGWGSDTSHIWFDRFTPLTWMRRVDSDFLSAEDAHNLPLQLASSVGVPGALLFFGIFAWAGIRSFHTVFSRASGSTGMIVGAFWAGAVGYLVHLLLAYSTVGITLFLWIALAVVLVPTARTAAVRARKRGTLAAVALLVVLAIGIGYQGVVLAADSSYVAAETEDGMSSRPYDQRVESALRAVELNPYNYKYRIGVGSMYLEELSGVASAVAAARETGQDTAQYAESLGSSFTDAESAFKEAIAFAPDLYVNYVNLASVYVLAGSALDEELYQRVFAVAERALQAKPLGIEIRMQLAEALPGLERTDEAIETLERCMEITPGGVGPALLLADVYQKAGRHADALALLRSVDALRPNHPDIAAAIRRLEAEDSQP